MILQIVMGVMLKATWFVKLVGFACKIVAGFFVNRWIGLGIDKMFKYMMNFGTII